MHYKNAHASAPQAPATLQRGRERKRETERKGGISVLAGQTERRRAGSTSMHISQTIKLELAFDTSLTNCLLNKRLELQPSRERFRRVLSPCKEGSPFWKRAFYVHFL